MNRDSRRGALRALEWFDVTPAAVDTLADRWSADAGLTQQAGTETQGTSSRHQVRTFVGQSDRYPVGWSILHPVPDPDLTPDGSCPYNTVGDVGRMTGLAGRIGTFYCLIEADGTLTIQEAA